MSNISISTPGLYGSSFAYIVDLADKNHRRLGFTTLQMLREYWNRRQVWHIVENGDPAGYLLFYVCRKTPSSIPRDRTRPHDAKIIHACIDYSLRRRHLAAGLIQAFINYVTRLRCDRIVLHCAEDLEANVFWRWMGFELTGQRVGGRKRTKRIHNKWVYDLSDPTQLRLW